MRLLYTSALIIAVSACSGHSNVAAPPVGHQAPGPSQGVVGALLHQDQPGASKAAAGWISPEVAKAATQLFYVADQTQQAVYIFPQKGTNPPPIGKITNGILGPDGLFVDKANKLYVCNFGGGTVTVYKKGSLTPSLTLTGAGSAIDVVVGVEGTVYVSNWDSGSRGTLLEYPKGHTTPSKTINIGGGPEGLALDSLNNLYVAYNDISANDGEVLKFKAGSTTGTNLGIHVGYAGGETIDSHNNLVLDDQNVPGVDIFPPGATHYSKQIKGFQLAFDIALNHADNRLYVTQPQNPAAVFQVTYPQGVLVHTINNTIQSAYGVAASPSGSN
jgi:hypothetical protein